MKEKKKEKKIKQKKIKDKAVKIKSDAFALYNFPYYNSSLNYFWLYPVKALLACLSAAFGVVYFAQLLNFSGGSFSFAAAAFIACGIYYVLLGFFKGPPVAAVTLCGLFLYCFAAVKRLDLAADAYDFLNQYMLAGEFLSADSFFGLKSDEGSARFMILISIVFGIIFAFCTAKRYHPDVIFVFSAVLAVPGFTSSAACFYPSLAIFTAGLLAIWAMNQSMGANIIIASGGAVNMRGADKEYRRSIKKLSPSAKIITDGKRYTRHISDGIIIFIVVAVTMNITASLFPLNGSVKFDKMIQKAISLGQEIGEQFREVITDLDIRFGGKSYLNGFFSADGKNINISNSINPNSGNRKGVPVLEVTTENKDKLYLRGDIGYDFDGDNWMSISKMDYSSLKYSYSVWRVEENGTLPPYDREIYIKDVFDNYVPEIQMLYARSLKSFSEDGSERVNPIGIETVKIDYLKNLNTVLFPGTPFVYNFRENNNFKIYGDFVGISGGSRINSMETGVLYLNQPVDMYNDYYDQYVFDQLETSLSLGEYERYKYAYEMFINEHYKTISSEYEKTIDDFARKCFVNMPVFYTEYDFQRECCDRVMDYLNSGRYTYSLTADNFSSKEHSPLYTFLYNTREGHCAMYATAMCLALRYQGIPARYVTGFTLGGDNCEQVDAGHYKYTLTDKDLHAWVEVYYKDLGWVPYDPTPGSIVAEVIVTAPATQNTPATSPAEDITETTSSLTTTPADTDTTTTTVQSVENTTVTTAAVTESEPDAPSLDPEVIKIILIISGAVLVLFVLFMTAFGFYKKLGRKQRELLKFFRKGAPTEAVKAMLPFMLRLLAIKGVVRNKGETPEEFGIRADKQLNMTDVVITTIPIFEKSEFDKDPDFGAEEQQAAYSCITKLLRDLLDNMKSHKRLATRIKLFGRNRKK